MASAETKTPPAGVSLTQDAWKRLRRSRPSMAALATLVSVVTLAFFTPLLPLQPPDRDFTAKRFAPPRLLPLLEQTFDFDAESVAALQTPIEEARQTLRSRSRVLDYMQSEVVRVTKMVDRFDAEATRIREDEKLAISPNDPTLFGELSTDGAVAIEQMKQEVAEATRQVRLARATVDSLVQRPYADAGYPRLDLLARSMVRVRYAIFGEWEIACICGRDKLGRDILSRIFWGARVSLIVGLVATLVSLVIGVSYGAISGYAGGSVDNVMMRVVDVLYSIPFVFLVIFIISVLSEDSVKEWLAGYGIDRITIFYLVVGAIYWLTMARVVRGQVVSLRNEQYVEAAQSLGVSQRGIIFRHIVPNLFSIVLVYLTLTIPRVILFEAFLSFLGLGVEPPDVSWGLLANEGIQVITPVKTYWWLIVFPSLAIGATLYALNFLGDGLRDAFDPRMKGR